jgi:hypothetical protein
MSPGKRRVLRVVLFTLGLLLLFLFLWLFSRNRYDETEMLQGNGGPGNRGAFSKDSGALLQSDSLTKKADRRTDRQFKQGAKPRIQNLEDAGRTDTLKVETPAPDTTPPHVRAEPGPGLHPAPIQVRLVSDEPAILRFRKGRDTAWSVYQAPFQVSDSLILTYQGSDTSGNISEAVTRTYVIAKPMKIRCPPDMAAVETEKAAFCMDRYEWPNKKGAEPLGYINWYMAYDSCRTYKKRLCTASEWEAACGGPSKIDYPYGAAYEERTCNTETTGPFPSGSLEECRSYFGVYDLSGNLREWTSTRAKNERHYQVYGGYWDNRGASRCNSTQYSFFPENRFIAIGFRCCKEGE